MRIPFLITLLAASVAMSGCSSHTKEPVELPVEQQSQYDQRVQDGLAPQKYTEAQMLYQRQLSGFQDQMDALERQRKALETGLSNSSYENDITSAPPSSAEAERIQSFQDAARKSQAKVAQSDAELSVRRALLENERDAKILDAERRVTEKLADIDREYSALVNLAEASSREIVNSRTQQDVAIQRASELARSSQAALLEQERFNLAVANAEELTKARSVLSAAQSESATISARYSSDIAALEAQIEKLRAEFSAALGDKQKIIAAAELEVARLAKTGDMLKAKPEPTLAVSGSNSAELQSFIVDQERRLADQKADIQRRKQARIDEVKNDLAVESNLITSRTRTQIAGLESATTIEKATVVAPVVTGRRVYSGEPAKAPENVQVKVAPVARPLASTITTPPVVVAEFKPVVGAESQSKREPQDVILAGGSTSGLSSSAGAPVVAEAKTRDVYDVLYTYKDEDSWEKFQKYLKAYGVSDFLASRNSKRGEWYIYAGRFYDEGSASRRVDYLNRLTFTSHAKVKHQQIAK